MESIRKATTSPEECTVLKKVSKFFESFRLEANEGVDDLIGKQQELKVEINLRIRELKEAVSDFETLHDEAVKVKIEHSQELLDSLGKTVKSVQQRIDDLTSEKEKSKLTLRPKKKEKIKPTAIAGSSN